MWGESGEAGEAGDRRDEIRDDVEKSWFRGHA
jgi:hypothetical protein